MKHLPVVLGLMVASGQAEAQDVPIPSVQADRDVLFGCLASGKGAEACVGAMTAVCMAENELASDNLTERLCVIEEGNAWRDLIADVNIVLGRALADHAADPVIGTATDALQASDAAWENYVISQCQFERASVARSPMRAIRENACQRDLSARRYQHLIDILEPLQ